MKTINIEGLSEDKLNHFLANHSIIQGPESITEIQNDFYDLADFLNIKLKSISFYVFNHQLKFTDIQTNKLADKCLFIYAVFSDNFNNHQKYSMPGIIDMQVSAEPVKLADYMSQLV